MNKRFKSLVSLLSIAILAPAIGCQRNASQSSQSQQDMDGKLTLRYADEIEVDSTTTIKASFEPYDTQILQWDQTCTFEVVSENKDAVEIAVDKKGTKATVTGKIAGEVQILVTSNANRNVSKKAYIEVIEKRPTPDVCIKNIQKASNYTIKFGSYNRDADNFSSDAKYTYVTENAIISLDEMDNPWKTVDGLQYYGEVIPSGENQHAVYLTKDASGFKTTSAPLVRGNIGLLTKDNFKGRKNEAKTVDEVGYFASLDAVNSSWLSGFDKADNNVYTITGDQNTTLKKSENMPYALAETAFWSLADSKSFDNEVKLLGDDIFPSLIASDIDTEITVLRSNALQIMLTVIGGSSDCYAIEITDVNETELPTVVQDPVSKITGEIISINQDLTKARTAINSHDYVQENTTYPDHKTAISYNTYYTENYVFHNCDLAFIKRYNELQTGGEDFPYKSPWGYIKKADGIYKFTYTAADADKGITEAVTLGEKVSGTDANSSLYKAEYGNYFSELEFLNSDLYYSFSDETSPLFDGDTDKNMHVSKSMDIMEQIIGFYDVDNDEVDDYVETAKSGLAVSYSSNKVSKIAVSVGMAPFINDDDTITDTKNYGVIRFEMKNFGSATTNPVDSLLSNK